MTYRKPLTKEQLAQLREEIKPLTQAFDLIHDHVVITDANANILYANRGVELHTGFSTEEAIGKTPGDLWGGLMDEYFYKKMWYTLKTLKSPFHAEVKNLKKDGSIYWQELSIYPILDKEGEVKIFIAFEPDITTRKMLEMHQDRYAKRKYDEELKWLSNILNQRTLQVTQLEEEIRKMKTKVYNHH